MQELNKLIIIIIEHQVLFDVKSEAYMCSLKLSVTILCVLMFCGSLYSLNVQN